MALLEAVVGATKEVVEAHKEKKEERIKELKDSILGVWELIDKNIIAISEDDERQIRVMINVMRDIKRLEKIATVIGGLSDQINIYKLASSKELMVTEKEKVKSTAQQTIKQYIQELNSFLSINLTFREEKNQQKV